MGRRPMTFVGERHREVTHEDMLERQQTFTRDPSILTALLPCNNRANTNDLYAKFLARDRHLRFNLNEIS